MAATFTLPDAADVEANERRGDPRALPARVPREGRPSRAPSRRRRPCCSTCSSASSRRRASSRSTRITSSPRRTSSGARSRSGTTRRWRCSRGRAPRSSLRPTARASGSASPTSTSRSPRSSRWSGLSAVSTVGSPASAATSRPRARTQPKLGWDAAHELWKANPLADWSDDDCWSYIRERGLPYNALHDRGYESIGDTHSTIPGAGREGRWADTGRTECGLHVEEPRP